MILNDLMHVLKNIMLHYMSARFMEVIIDLLNVRVYYKDIWIDTMPTVPNPLEKDSLFSLRTHTHFVASNWL